MAIEKAGLNVVSDDEDRGPLVEDEELAAVKALVASLKKFPNSWG